MSKLTFVKYQGAGNDFILIDDRTLFFPFSLVPKLCHRRFGVGADGVILLQNDPVADFRMRIFNSDGSEAESCGNGLRCLAAFLLDLGFERKPYRIATLARVVDVEYRGDLIAVKMGENFSGSILDESKIRSSPQRRRERREPQREKKRYFRFLREFFKRNNHEQSKSYVNLCGPLPLLRLCGEFLSLQTPNFKCKATLHLGEREVYFCDTGVPHAVIFVEDVEQIDLMKEAPAIRHHEAFGPKGANVNFAKVKNEGMIEVRTFERGLEGESWACGTGAVAVAIVGIENGWVKSPVSVVFRGGEVEIRKESEEVWMVGAASRVFQGVFETP